jgi:iron(III) transport system substrate-binding protein
MGCGRRRTGRVAMVREAARTYMSCDFMEPRTRIRGGTRWRSTIVPQLRSVVSLRALVGTLAAALVAFASATAGVAQPRTSLLVYSTLEPDHIADFKQAFEHDNPDIEIVWIRDSTGVVTARILAEGSQQKGDAIWGLAVTSTAKLKKLGLLEPYAPANLAAIRPGFRDKSDPPAWVGMEAWVGAVCLNTVEAAKHKLPAPKSWFDLIDPVYKGRIVMPNPASSGTGYFHVSAWIQLFGEDKAWAFMDALNKNVAHYEHSGTKPCRQAATGEFAVGISYELAGATLKSKNAPIDILLMKEGGGWDMDTAAILKGTQKLAAAKRLMDFAASRKANEMYAKYVSQVAIEGVAKPIPNYPEGVAQSMIKNDLEWASEHRDRILAEWTKRYTKPK